ncbi:hypothetical protein [Streptomyces sp. NPDC090056]|uniref:hypothetical protein n=1 Tax=Streptomyces sp. NPDC090056 TaxID=3365934 RepID=UPI00381D2F0C
MSETITVDGYTVKKGDWVPALYPSTAILRRVTGPGPTIELELEPEHCRFVSP